MFSPKLRNPGLGGTGDVAMCKVSNPGDGKVGSVLGTFRGGCFLHRNLKGLPAITEPMVKAQVEVLELNYKDPQ